MAVDVSSLPPDTAKFVTGVISAGKYPSADAVVVTALRLLEDRERSVSELNEKIATGIEDFSQGDYIEISDETDHRALFDRLKADLLATHPTPRSS